MFDEHPNDKNRLTDTEEESNTKLSTVNLV